MDNKQITIAAICGMLILLMLVISCSRGCSSKKEPRIVTPKPRTTVTTTPSKIDKEDDDRPSYSYSSFSGSRGGNAPSVLTEEDKVEIARSYEENQELMNKLKKKWMDDKLKDPKVSPVAKEQYKLRSNPNFIIGMQAIDNSDYKTAIQNFNEILKDKNTSPVSKHFACSIIMDIAMQLKDPELYFIAARTKGRLEATEDLSILKIEKGTFTLDWCDRVENTLKAKNDPKYFDICVQKKLAGRKEPISIEYREKAKKDVEKDIRFYSEKFKELIE